MTGGTASSNPNDDCLFCKIVAGTVPSDQVYTDDQIVAFRDISPQAPVHILVVPRQHADGIDALRDNPALAGRLLAAAATIARAEGLHQSGYRLAINQGRHGAQSVGHVHLHVLGGRQLSGQLG